MHCYACLLDTSGEERGREQGPAAENWPATGNKLQMHVSLSMH